MDRSGVNFSVGWVRIRKAPFVGFIAHRSVMPHNLRCRPGHRLRYDTFGTNARRKVPLHGARENGELDERRRARQIFE
jgi:hypothetical protein